MLGCLLPQGLGNIIYSFCLKKKYYVLFLGIEHKTGKTPVFIEAYVEIKEEELKAHMRAIYKFELCWAVF